MILRHGIPLKNSKLQDIKISDATCSRNSDCELGKTIRVGNGIQTGRCVPSKRRGLNGNNTCEIVGWCPAEQDVLQL